MAYFGPLYVMGAVVAALVVWSIIRDRARTRDIRQLAQRAGLTYGGSAVPERLPLPGKLSHHVESIRRVVAGAAGNKDLVLFDCELYGKGNRTRTVVAVRGQPYAFGLARFWPDLVTEQVGEWALVYADGRLLDIEEIEALVSVASDAPAPASHQADSQR